MRLSLALLAAVAAAQSPPSAKITFAGKDFSYYHSSGPEARSPLLVLLSGGEDDPKFFQAWSGIAGPRNWRLIMPLIPAGSDPGAKTLEAMVLDARRRFAVDESRIWLAGSGAAGADVFFVVSRLPDLWAAALALSTNPAAAINTNRIFAANSKSLPLLWMNPPPLTEMSQQRLRTAEFNFQVAEKMPDAQIFDWLAGHRRDPAPATVDCETGSPAFARCYWIEMTKFDVRRRNDALPSTRVRPGSGASLALGGFGYDPHAEGPGALVTWLPENYQGELRLQDRIVSVAGKILADGREYMQLMDELKEEKAVAVLVQRGSARIRVETRVQLPKREENVTARAQGMYLPDQNELLIITRGVSELKVTIPPAWAPLTLTWNGSAEKKIEAPGCWLLNHEQEKPVVRPCI